MAGGVDEPNTLALRHGQITADIVVAPACEGKDGEGHVEESETALEKGEKKANGVGGGLPGNGATQGDVKAVPVADDQTEETNEAWGKGGSTETCSSSKTEPTKPVFASIFSKKTADKGNFSGSQKVLCFKDDDEDDAPKVLSKRRDDEVML